MKKIATLLIFTTHVMAYTPTLHSLLGNSENIDTEDKTATITLTIKESKEDESEFYNLKLYINNEKKYKQNICQYYYADGVINSSTLAQIQCFNIKELLSKSSLEQGILYGLVLSYVNNSPEQLIQTLNKMGAKISLNRYLVNKEQSSYLKSYLDYLLASKEDESLQNPLESEDKEIQAKINKILSVNYLNKDEYINRVKNGMNYFWLYNDSVVRALFDGENNRLLKLSLKKDEDEVVIIPKSYQRNSFGIFYPQSIEIKGLSKQVELNFNKVHYFNENGNSFARRNNKNAKKVNDSRILKKSALTI
ncbi:MAG: hypothetical protein N4A33_08965 [Bacteriovoracaceae bacterium]|jgi:hypothetical protein|nr:hypothetical protein [Bacteriovoracaceae bacterium]